jgi:RecA-family ATPase
MDMVVDKLAQIACKTNCAIGLVHHTTKGVGEFDRGTVDKARGASAITDASRVTRTLFPMRTAEADKMGIPPEDIGSYVWVTDAKANFQRKRSCNTSQILRLY